MKKSNKTEENRAGKDTPSRKKQRHIIKMTSSKQSLKCLCDLSQSELYVPLAPEVILNPIYLQTAHVLEPSL